MSLWHSDASRWEAFSEAAARTAVVAPTLASDAHSSSVEGEPDTIAERIRLRRIQVVIVIGSLGIGGAQKHVFDLIRLLDRREFEVSVIVFDTGGFYYDQLLSLGHRVLTLQVDTRWDLLRRLPRFLQYVRSLEPHVLHVFLYYSSLFGCLMRLARPWRSPRIVLSKRSMNVDLRADRYLLYRYVLMKLPHAITAVSESVKHRCLELGARARKVRIIHNGIEWCDKPSPGALHALLGIPAGSVVLGSVGSLTIRKRPGRFLEAAACVLREVPEACVVMLGEGPLRPALERQSRELGIAGRVHLPGNVFPALNYIGDFTVFSLPSSEEGMSNALLEAMMVGLPCVASNIPSNREVITDGIDGILVDVEDRAAYVAALLDLVRSPARRKHIGVRAIETVRRNYSIEAMLDKNIQLYRELAKDC